MNVLIQSLPSPSAYSGELLTHGWGNHGWLMKRRRWWWWRWSPPNPRPDRVPERSFWFPNWGFWWRLRSGTLLWKNDVPPWFLGQGLYIVRRRGRGGARGGYTTPRRGLGWPAPRHGVGPPWLFSVSSSGSVSLRAKYGFCDIFREFSWKLDFCTKTRHQGNSAENSVSLR